MDKETRNRIQRATQQARTLLEEDYERQLDGTYDIPRTGRVAELPGAHLEPWRLPIRGKLVAAVEHRRAGGLKPAEAVAAYLREAAFTTLNRFVALKMLEARGLVQEALSKGEQSSGFREFTGLAPGLSGLPDHGYRLYLESLFDEIGQEVKVLFDRSEPASLLWPSHQVFHALLDLLNQPDLAEVWKEDETLGWVYQYFNSDDERKKMRKESRTPRNSREMAVRNQFFTPRYVVEFLTDNTLGRTWYEMRQGETALVEQCQYLVRRRRPVFLKLGEVGPEPFVPTESSPGRDEAAMWTRPNPDLEAPLDIYWYAMTVSGPDWAERVLGQDCCDLSDEKETAWQDTGKWDGTFETLRCCLYHQLRREDRSGGPPETWPVDQFRSLHQEICRRWDLETEHIPFRARKDPRDLKILDPACGSGHFLLYCFDLLATIYQEAWSDPESPASEATGRTLRQDYATPEELRAAIPGLVLRHNLHGIDIDPRAAQIAALALWMRAQRAYGDFQLPRSARPPIRKTNIVVAEPMPGEPELRQEFLATLDRPLAGLVEKVFQKMELAGEAGSLLRIEEDIRDAIRDARKKWQSLPQGAQLSLEGFEPKGEQMHLQDLWEVSDEGYWEQAERRVYEALERYAGGGRSGGAFRRRLFAEDAARGFAFIDMCRQKYDVALMNPPFGNPSRDTKKTLEQRFPSSKGDVLAVFVERLRDLLNTGGLLGAITSRTPFFLGSFSEFRKDVLLEQGAPLLFADLGDGVLEAMVETCAWVYRWPRPRRNPDAALFFRLLVEEAKDDSLVKEIHEVRTGHPSTTSVFAQNPGVFTKLPSAPFCYWAPPKAISKLGMFPPIEGNVASVRVGLQTGDDFRFLRTLWEIPPTALAPSPHSAPEDPSQVHNRCKRELAPGGGKEWVFYSKTDAANPWFSPISLAVKWARTGREIKNFCDKNGKLRSAVRSEGLYFNPGFSYMLRSSRLVPYVVPAGVIPTAGRAQVFPEPGHEEVLLAWCASNLASSIARFSGEIFARPKFQAGMVQGLPWSPDLLTQASALQEAVQREIEARNSAARYLEPFLEFEIPRALDLGDTRPGPDTDLRTLLGPDLEYAVGTAFGLSSLEMVQVEQDLLEALSLRADTPNQDDDAPNEDGDEVEEDLDCAAEMDMMSAASHSINRIFSYCTGAAFGRWDVRLALEPSLRPDKSGAFAPLPCVPAGSLVSPDGDLARLGEVVSTDWLRLRRVAGQTPTGVSHSTTDEGEYPVQVAWRGILVDDIGNNSDIAWRTTEVLRLFPGVLAQLEEELGDAGLRSTLASDQFSFHIKQYTYGGRKAPIYWQLATPSASYSVWLYYHRLTRDTFYQVLNDFVVPKVRHEEAKLTELRQDAGPSPTTKQRKEIDDQETFVEELRAYREEVERVAPLWNPNLNDGVIINFAPLWRLVPQHREWQKECRECWNKLAAGDYDWAHLAMHLWPERVAPKCATDRSLAIAHDLEEVFWQEGPDGKWRQKPVPPETIAALVAERTSPAVRDARDQLLQAPEPLGRRGARRAASTPRPPRAPRAPRPTAPEPPTAPTPRARATANPQAREAILRHLATTPTGASKADLLAATALDESAWKPTIDELLATNQVTRTGEKRGTKYHVVS